jgi:hypothetical protein
MTKKDMVKCYKDLSTCDIDKVEHVVNAIYQTFDTDNNGKLGTNKIFHFGFFHLLSNLFIKL